jgi:hypothetical protein
MIWFDFESLDLCNMLVKDLQAYDLDAFFVRRSSRVLRSICPSQNAKSNLFTRSPLVNPALKTVERGRAGHA